jgi:hypothetical protein
MNKETSEHIYMKKDIDKAFNMGLETAMSVFEETIGMSQEKQRIVLNKIKEMLIKDKVEVAMSSSYMKF